MQEARQHMNLCADQTDGPGDERCVGMNAHVPHLPGLL